MNAQNVKYYLPLVQALADGKQLQKNTVNFGWVDINELDFSEDPSKYRIKPEPRTIWVVYDKTKSLHIVCLTDTYAKEVCDDINGTISVFKEVL